MKFKKICKNKHLKILQCPYPIDYGLKIWGRIISNKELCKSCKIKYHLLESK